MRFLSLVTAATLLAISLSGCFGNDDTPGPDPVDTCSDEDRLNATNTACYVAPPAPNMLPEATLTITDAAGNAMDASTYVVAGSNLTFSAAGTFDPDGNLSAVGLSIVDGNGTRVVQLFDGSSLVDVTLNFAVAGPVVATMNVLDNDGEGVIRSARTAVNGFTNATLSFDGPAPSGAADACQPPGASSGVPPLVSDSYALKTSVSVEAEAQWISAKITAGSAEIAICSPGDPGTALSPAGTDVETADDVNATLAVNPLYYVMVVHKGNSPGDVTVSAMVHFETKTA